MSDDLVKRLRNPPFGTDTSERLLMKSAADRIEALEAALAKAQVGLETIRDIAPRSKFTKQIAACADDALKSISGATR